MRKLLLPFLAGAAHAGAQAQLVVEMGGGIGLQGVHFMALDSAANDLLLAGAFAWANEVPVSPGVLRWNEQGVHSIGCGVEWDCVTPGSQAGLANPVGAIAKWNDDMYLGGGIFFTRGGFTYNGIMRWDGNEWYPLGGGTDGPVKSIKVIDDQLIVAGWFTYADTVLANGLARWDGERWHRVVDVPVLYNGGGPNLIQDVEKYQGEWYLGGNHTMRDLIKWNGEAWEIVGEGFLGGFSQVNKLRVYDGRLYVAGSFSRCPEHAGVPTNPGSGIVAWDGANWDDLGGGTCGSPNGSVGNMLWQDGELYVTGLFNRIGGQEGHRLAKWDGQQWCMLVPPNFWGTGGPGALAVYNDSLYIGGAFLTAGGQDASCFVKWVGGDYTYSCGALTGLEDFVDGTGELTVYPNPASAAIRLSAPNWASARATLHIVDAAGRVVLAMPWVGTNPEIALDVDPGVYAVVLQDAVSGRRAVARFVKQ